MSKGLKALHELTKVIKGVDTSLYQYNEYISDIEKELKALEIIKDILRKDLKIVFVDITGHITFSINDETFVYEPKTPQEYDLLKEELCND